MDNAMEDHGWVIATSADEDVRDQGQWLRVVTTSFHWVVDSVCHVPAHFLAND